MKAHHRFADLLFVVLLLTLVLLITLVSPFGTKAIASLVNTMIPLITIEGESGTLLEGLQLDKLTIKNEVVHIEFTDLNIDWAKVIYKNKKLYIKQLHGETLTIYLPEKNEKKKGKTIIPDIPIPIDLIADDVALNQLTIINAEQKTLFQAKRMSIKNADISSSLLTADVAKATLIIKNAPMLVNLKQAQLDFNQPHDIKGHGGIHYSNIQTGTVDGTVSVAGTLTDYELEGILDWDELVLGRSVAQIKGKGDYSGVEIEQLRLDNESAVLNIKGKLSWTDAFKWKLSLNSDEIRTKKYRPDWPAVFSLILDAEGRYDDEKQMWSVLLDTKKLDGQLANYPLQAAGKIIIKDSFELFLVENIDLKSGDNRLQIDGKITEPMRLQWDINAKKLTQLLPDMQGEIVGKGVLTGTTLNPSGEGKLLINNLNAQGIQVGFANVKLKAGADGSLRSGNIKSSIKKLAYKDFSVASAKVDFQGTENQSLLQGRGTLHVKQLQSKQLSLQTADVTFNGTPKKLDFDAVFKELMIAGQTIKRSTLRVKGEREQHRIMLNSSSKLGNLQLQAEGGIEETSTSWFGKVSQLKLDNTLAGHWQLNKPVRLQMTGDSVSGSELCLNNPKRGMLCSIVAWQKDKGVKAKGTLKRIPLAQFKPWLPSAVDLVGFANGRYDIQQKGTGFYGQAEFQLSDSLIRYSTEAGREKIAYRNGKIRLRLNDNLITADAKLKLEEWGTVNSKAKITLSPSTQQHKITGEASFTTSRLAWFNDYFPNVNKLKGKVSSTVKINGLLKKPRISAELLLKDGQMRIPDTGAYLSDIQIQIKSDKQKKVRIDGSLLAGEGKLTIAGWFDYAKKTTWRADVELKGTDLHVMNTHEVQAYASPAITVKATPKTVAVMGRLHLPKAKITLDEIPETAIYESDDVVFVGDKNKKKVQKQKKKLQIMPNVNISLGNDIQFKGFGLTGKLRGNFNVADNLNTILSRGTLSVVDGEYRAYGQVLTIEQGMLIFNGPIGNPGLNIRATRNVEDLKVGLNLAGTLKAPKSSIFSNPTLPDDEALSYLLTGQALTGENDANTQLLLQAVRSLGISGGGNLLDRIGGSLGVDDVNVITFDDYKKNKIQLGKRLGTDLYVRYITGLFDAFHKIAIDYRMSDKWSLQAESGEEQAIDFIYEVR